MTDVHMKLILGKGTSKLVDDIALLYITGFEEALAHVIILSFPVVITDDDSIYIWDPRLTFSVTIL